MQIAAKRRQQLARAEVGLNRIDMNATEQGSFPAGQGTNSTEQGILGKLIDGLPESALEPQRAEKNRTQPIVVRLTGS